MSEIKEVKVKAKGTKVTESIIGAASSKILSATKNLNDATTMALKMVETLDQNTLKIVDQEDKLANLQIEFNNRKVQSKIDLDLEFQTNRKLFAERYLTESELTAIPREQLSKLQDALIEWETKFQDKVNTEIGKANGIAENKIKANERIVQLEYDAKEAQNLSKIQNLESQLAFANKQSDSWEKQLNSERQASIERSKNNSAIVNVAPSGK